MAGFSDAFFMQKALEQANLAYEKDEVPVGAILVKNNDVLSAAHNLSITKNEGLTSIALPSGKTI